MKEILQELRRELHQYPEISGKEQQTASRIARFVEQYQPTHMYTGIGGNGVIAVFDSGIKGPAILFRSELDALPIQEVNDFSYASRNKGVGHKCGHDGHMAMVAGLAAKWKEQPLPKGKLILLFQPAEETGQGAAAILQEGLPAEAQPDYVFALHNLPGYDEGEVVIRNGTFAAGSKGFITKLTGKTSHAAEPENGNSPAMAVAELLQQLEQLVEHTELKDFSLVTPIHAKLGERAFGTTPGYAEVMATLRSYNETDLDELTKAVESIAKQTAQKHQLQLETEWVEVFPVTAGTEDEVAAIDKAANQLQLKIHHASEPVRWSEDFGYFTKQYKGALFGLGSGKEQPALHNPEYDFPDEILETGTNLFYTIAQIIANER